MTDSKAISSTQHDHSDSSYTMKQLFRVIILLVIVVIVSIAATNSYPKEQQHLPHISDHQHVTTEFSQTKHDVNYLATLAKEAKTETEICSTILKSIQHLNFANKTLTYQCRPGDNCGGASDRFAGVMSGVYYAILSGRSFRMHWPGIDHVFAPHSINWAFHNTSYGIPADEVQHKGLVSIVWGAGSITSPFSHNDVVIFNDLNTREINNPKVWSLLTHYNHIFYHSNRDPDTGGTFKHIAEQYQWPVGDGDLEHNYYIAYRCIFNDIFQPSPEFLTTPYKPLQLSEMPFSQVISIVEDLDHVSLAYHYRIEDKHVASDPLVARLPDTEIRWLIEFGQQHRSQSAQKMNLFFISNSVNSALKLLANSELREVYNAVYCQELTGKAKLYTSYIWYIVFICYINALYLFICTYINDYYTGTRHINAVTTASSHSLKQAMMDWWVMRQARYLVCGASGFCKMAGTVASEEQVKIDAVTKRVVPHSYHICTNREC